MSYSYLATLRLNDGDGGKTLTVGPNRRVVFKNKILAERKDEIKRVLSPLKDYWGEDDLEKLRASKRDPDKPMMGFMMFRLAAKRLLTEAGMLREPAVED